MTQDVEKHNRLLRKLKNKPERSAYVDPKDFPDKNQYIESNNIISFWCCDISHDHTFKKVMDRVDH